MPTVTIPDRICPHCGGNKWYFRIRKYNRGKGVYKSYRCDVLQREDISKRAANPEANAKAAAWRKKWKLEHPLLYKMKDSARRERRNIRRNPDWKIRQPATNTVCKQCGVTLDNRNWKLDQRTKMPMAKCVHCSCHLRSCSMHYTESVRPIVARNSRILRCKIYKLQRSKEMKAYTERYNKLHRGERIAWRKRWGVENKEHVSEYDRKRSAENRENLTDSYVKSILSKYMGGKPRIEITQEQINNYREYLKVQRLCQQLTRQTLLLSTK